MATYLDAAHMILKETGKPMPLQEIVMIAVERGLITPVGSSPLRVMRTLIYEDMKKRGNQSRFVHIGVNQFKARDIETISILPDKTIRGKNLETRQKSHGGFSYKDAALAVLAETGRPMTVSEITQTAIDKGYINHIGKLPIAAMNTQIYNEIKQDGNTSVFIKVGRGLFFLRDNSLGIQSTQIVSPIDKNVSPLGGEKQKNVSKLISYFDSHHLAIQKEIDTIRLFLMGRLEHRPPDEKLCDWVLLCYLAEMFQEGRELFPLINPDAVQCWYFEKAKRLARLCSLRVPNHV